MLKEYNGNHWLGNHWWRKERGKKERSGMKSYYLIDSSFVKTPIWIAFFLKKVVRGSFFLRSCLIPDGSSFGIRVISSTIMQVFIRDLWKVSSRPALRHAVSLMPALPHSFCHTDLLADPWIYQASSCLPQGFCICCCLCQEQVSTGNLRGSLSPSSGSGMKRQCLQSSEVSLAGPSAMSTPGPHSIPPLLCAWILRTVHFPHVSCLFCFCPPTRM